MGEMMYGAVSALYGNYVVVPPGESIDEAKALLLEQIKSTIDELAKDDRFWIVHEAKEPIWNPPGVEMGSHTVGWKLIVPQLADKVDGITPEEAEKCRRRLSL